MSALRALWRWWRRWGVVTLTAAWLVDEVYEGVVDAGPDAWPLTRVIVTYLPPWLYIPGAIALGVWLVPHLWLAGVRLRRRDV